ncbi:hypothetical protein IGI66_002894 [Enterococcus sp. AZ048]
MENRTLYVLELENQNYYIGQSANLDKRLKKHFKGKGSA